MLGEEEKGEAIFNYESQTDTVIMNLARKSNRDSFWLKETYDHELFVDG